MQIDQSHHLWIISQLLYQFSYCSSWSDDEENDKDLRRMKSAVRRH